MDMADHFDDAAEFAAQKLGLPKLKSQQTIALRQFVQGHDLFVNLPTGFGKSVIFQAAPIILDFLNERRDHSETESVKALVIVVLPLKALVVDQLDRVRKIGLQAEDITTGISDDVLEHSHEYSLIFASPETLCGARGKELIQSVKDRCFALFVDESHCVSKWGHSSGQSAAFRKCYGQLGELRSMLKLKTSIVALTATATKNVRKTVVDSLAMKNYGLIEESPERANIKYAVERVSTKSFDDIFEWLCKELHEKKGSADRIILYCQSRKQVTELYTTFCSVLPPQCHMYFNMYHTNTEDVVQRSIIESFSKENGEIRVLFATIAFGMGIDVCGVHTVIMVGHPTDLDDLMQLSGRAGRDGVQSVAVLLEYPGAGAGVKTTDEMKTFLKGERCRREVIRESFPSSGDSCVSVVKHDCCDVCTKTCTCEGQMCTGKPSLAEQQLHNIATYGPSASAEYPVVSVPDSDMGKLTENLQEYRETLLSGTSCHLYTGGDMACGLSLNTIKEITSECHIIFSCNTFCDRYVFSTQEIALAAWDIVQTTLNRQSDPSLAMKYLSDNTSPEDSDDDCSLSGEYADIVLYSSDSD